jgi:phosphatidylethanolamine/phosphatidyl-N-methylethanolamine N-methyltransferase
MNILSYMREDLENFYRDQYKEISYSGLGLIFSNYFHKKLEISYSDGLFIENVLEVGAGNGQHINFVKHKYKKYIQTDILDYNNFPETSSSNLIFEIQDAQDLKYEDGFFDRVVSTCLLHHLDFPERALLEWRRVAKNEGSISILVPSDPGFFYRVSRKLGSELKVKLRGINQDLNYNRYQYIHAIDHRNHFASLDKIIKFIFLRDKIHVKNYPLGIPFWNLNLFTVYEIIIQKDGASS